MLEIERCSPKLSGGKLNIRIHVEVTHQGHTRRLSGGHIEQTLGQVCWFNGCYGRHFTYHDADDSHQHGRIHERLYEKAGGRFIKLPSNVAIGTEAWCRKAPAFKDIPSVQPLAPEETQNLTVLLSKDSLLDSLDPVKGRHFKADCVFPVLLPQDSNGLLGPILLATKPNCKIDLQKWCERQLQVWQRDGLVEVKCWLIDTMEPHLALVAGWCRV